MTTHPDSRSPPGSSTPARERVLLHVGTPKTGTSYLQDVLFRNREVLRGHGILYPADRFDGHFLAALDLMRLTWGGLETQAVGAWDRLAEQVRAWPGTSIVSHEILSTASPMQIDRALTSFGEGVEVHLIVSVRDLVRQVPAEWQENVKHRSLVSYAHFLEMIRDPDRDTRIGSWFWGAQEIPDILDRWGAILPPEQVHLVTVPRPGSAPDELWRRFSRAFGLDGLDLDLTPERANPSLGVPETALLRLVNKRVTPVVDPPDYRPLVRELLAHQTLSRRTSSARLGLPAGHARVGPGPVPVVDRGGRAARVRRRGRPRRPPRRPGRRPSPTPTRRRPTTCCRPRSTRSPRCSSRARGCASRRPTSPASSRRPATSWTWPGARTAERTVQALEARPAGRRALGVYRLRPRPAALAESADGRSGGLRAAGCAAAARGRRTGRRATSRSRRRPHRPRRPRPGCGGRRWWPAACRRPG